MCGMKIVAFVLTTLLGLTACASTQVILRHTSTGREVICGPYSYAPWGLTEVIARQKQSDCVAEYQRQGYERMPPP